MRVTQPFDASTLLSIDPELRRRVGFAQGHESFDLAQDREPVERLVEWPFDLAQGREPAERQMGVFRQTRNYSLTRVTYSPVRVSTVIFVPSSMKGGTRNS